MVLPDFFPDGVVHFFTGDRYGVEALSAKELEFAGSYGAKRMKDFCTGRYCMRKCTAHYGFTGDIMVGERGMPILPEFIAASLSHSKNICGAVAGGKDKFQSLGLDIETVGRVNEDLWRLLFLDSETELLKGMDEEQQRISATIFFSMKEAFYKMQYPLTDTFLDFHEVEVIPNGDEFSIRLLTPSGEFDRGQLFSGSVFQTGQEIVSFCALPV
jgi:4'-phosphopantetheinyl transferase EntD